jgi:hypothetical protein
MKCLTYAQGLGVLSCKDGFLATGYAGADAGKNNPAMQDVKNVGPLPRGRYTISGPECVGTTFPCPDCHGATAHRHGPYVLRLHPVQGNEMFGRAGFLVHGDNGHGTASEGCICIGRTFRQQVTSEGYTEIEVVA